MLAPGFACRQTDDKPPPVEVVGSLASVRIAFEPFSLTILDALGAPVLRTLEGGASDAYGGPAATRDDGIDNVKVIPGWDAFVPDDKPWAHPARAKLIARSDTGASIELTTEQGSIAIEVQLDGAKVTIRTSSRGGSPAWNKTSLAFALRPDEHFFGLGERYGSVDHRGRSLYSWSEEGGLGGGEGKPTRRRRALRDRHVRAPCPLGRTALALSVAFLGEPFRPPVVKGATRTSRGWFSRPADEFVTDAKFLGPLVRHVGEPRESAAFPHRKKEP